MYHLGEKAYKRGLRVEQLDGVERPVIADVRQVLTKPKQRRSPRPKPKHRLLAEELREQLGLSSAREAMVWALEKALRKKPRRL